jgi:hypothetical protein
MSAEIKHADQQTPSSNHVFILFPFCEEHRNAMNAFFIQLIHRARNPVEVKIDATTTS